MSRRTLFTMLAPNWLTQPRPQSRSLDAVVRDFPATFPAVPVTFPATAFLRFFRNARGCRSAYRLWSPPSLWNYDLGIRPAWSSP